MKIAIIIVRVLIGLLFVFGSVTYFLNLVPQPELTGKVKIFMEGLSAATYLFPLVKSIELICGIAFLFGRFVPLACILISPIIVNIFLVHVFVDPSGFGIGVGTFLVIANFFLASANWDKFKPLLEAK